MPRKRKVETPVTNGRSDAQTTGAAVPITGMPYGQNGDLNNQAKGLPVAQGPAPLPTAPPAMPMAPPDPIGAGIQAAQATPFQPSGLARPTERPNEPITTGLPMGAGAGIEALAQPPKTVSTALNALAQAQGNQTLARYAAQAASQGL